MIRFNLTNQGRFMIAAAVVVALCIFIIVFGVGTETVRTVILPGQTKVVTKVETKTVVEKVAVPVRETRYVPAKTKIDPTANAAALRKLCKRAAYRNSKQCRPYRS